MSLTELARLKNAWEKAYSRQAKGGENAVAGFHFQFLEVLLDTVRSWLALPTHRRANPVVLGEWLSDLVNATDPVLVVVTQIKYTQSSGMVKGALDDLFRIYEVALAQTPDLQSRLRFRILSARPSLKNVSVTVNAWCPEGTIDTDPKLIDFRSRLSVEIHSDPENDLLALLVKELHADSPLSLLHEWVGRLIEAAVETDGYRRVAREIWNDLQTLDREGKKRKTIGVHVWTTQDRSPDAVRSGRFLTGEQPLVKHLREGFFAPRPDLFTRLADSAANWIISNPTEADESLRLQLFWIGGRSGAGKSVALLHVLALLHERGYGPILWLGNKVANLPAAIRFARELQRPFEPVIIGIDDPYTAAVQGDAIAIWREAVAELQELRESGQASPLPLVICCGPTEQADRLRDDFVDDVVVRIEILRNETEADIDELRAWYRARTGREPPDAGNENVLLVQLFFEWTVGLPIAEFALRFRKRVVNADPRGGVENAISRMLALNRLYVGYSFEAFQQALNPEQRDVVAKLRTEEHLEESSNDRPGLWLAHPHLANAIYEAWHPARNSENVRMKHLRIGIRDALATGASPSERTAPLWAISLVFGSNSTSVELARRVNRDNARALLEETYQQLAQGAETMPLSLLPVWIQVRVRAAGITLVPDPITVALDRIRDSDPNETGLRLTCHKLLEHLHAFDNALQLLVIDSIIGLLAQSFDWHGWVYIATNALTRTKDERLWPLIAKWYMQHQFVRAAPRLLLLALEASNDSIELRRSCESGLSIASATGAWSRIAFRLLKAALPGRPSQAVLTWLGSNWLSRDIGYFVGKYLELNLPESLPWALEWAGQWHLVRNASFVLEPLCDVLPTNPNVIRWCKAWLHQGHANTGFLMKKLLNACPNDPDVVDLGKQWLQSTPDEHGSWAHVWEALWRSNPDDREIQLMGSQWLTKQSIDMGSFTFVWEALWNPADPDDSHVRLGLEWLSKMPATHPSWSYLWCSLWLSYRCASRPDAVGIRAQILNCGMQWLSAYPPPRAFGYVWLPLWNDGQYSAKLRDCAVSFLAAVEAEHPSRAVIEGALRGGDKPYLYDDARAAMWAQRFESSISSTGSVSHGLRREGLWYLTSSYHHHLWASVFLRLWQLGDARNTLTSLGNEWIKLHPDGRRAAEVFDALGLVAPPEAIAQAAILPRKAPRFVADLKSLESIELFVVREGLVEAIVDFGIFINIGLAVGLLHISDLPVAHAANLREFYEEGQPIQVVVKSVDLERRKVALGLAGPSPLVWPNHLLDEMAVGEVVDGIVAKALPRHGIFVNIRNIVGIVPGTQVPEAQRQALTKNFSSGQALRLQILSIDRERQRVELGFVDGVSVRSLA